MPSVSEDTETSNQNWGVTPEGTYGNVVVALGSTVPDRPDYMPRSQENPRVATHRVRDDFPHVRRFKLDVDSPEVATLLSIQASIVVVMTGRVQLLNIVFANLHC